MLQQKDPKTGKSLNSITAKGTNMLSDPYRILDLHSGSDFKEIIERLRGEILDNWQTTGSLAALFAKGGFLLKVVACSGDENGPMVLQLGGAILGIKW